MRKNVIVIGSGIGGLAIACRLAARGLKVILLEKNPTSGGKMMSYQVGGYTFHLAPCLLSRLDSFADLFQLCGRRMDDFVQFSQLDPQYRIFFEDGRSGVIGWSEAFGSFISLDTGETKPFTCNKNSSQFAEIQLSTDLQDPFLVAAALAPAIFAGCDPGKISLRYAFEHRLVFPQMLYHPIGGIQSLLKGLCQTLLSLDGTIQYNSEVEQILTSNKRVTGVRLTDGQKLFADYVISDADYQYTRSKLLRNTELPIYSGLRLKRYLQGPSLFAFCFGIKKRFEPSQLCHHNFFISRNFPAMIKQVYRENLFSTELFFYLQNPTITDPSLAPNGSSIMQIIVPVPNLRANVDWSTMFHIYREQIIRLIDETLIPGFQKNIEVDISLTPTDFAGKFNFTQGSLFRGPINKLERVSQNPLTQTGLPNFFTVSDGSYPGWGIESVLTTVRMVDSWISI